MWLLIAIWWLARWLALATAFALFLGWAIRKGRGPRWDDLPEPREPKWWEGED